MVRNRPTSETKYPLTPLPLTEFIIPEYWYFCLQFICLKSPCFTEVVWPAWCLISILLYNQVSCRVLPPPHHTAGFGSPALTSPAVSGILPSPPSWVSNTQPVPAQGFLSSKFSNSHSSGQWVTHTLSQLALRSVLSLGRQVQYSACHWHYSLASFQVFAQYF